MRRYVPLFALVAACGSSAPIPAPTSEPTPVPPATIDPLVRPVIDTYHGVAVSDNYRWLETPTGESLEVKAFVDAQNSQARAFLDQLPERAKVKDRLAEILGAATVGYSALEHVAGVTYALKLEPPKAQRMLVQLNLADPEPHFTKADFKERVVVDPNALDASGGTSIDWFHVSPNGKYVAISLSKGGSETGDVHIFETSSGKPAFEVIPGVNAGTAGGDLHWLPDSLGFYYSRYPRGDERPADDKLFYVQLYRHMLGQPTEQDTYELGKDFVRIAEVFIDVAPNGDALCTVQKGDGGEFELYLQRGGYKLAGPWRKIAAYEDEVVQGFFGPRDDLYLVSRKDAPRGKLLMAKRKDFREQRSVASGEQQFELAKAKVIVPEGEATLVTDIWYDNVLVVTEHTIYATYQLGGPSMIRAFDLDGKPAKYTPEQPPVSAVGELVPVGKDLLFSVTSFLAPTTWYRYTPKQNPVKLWFSARSPVDLVGAGVKVVREMATSKDGTQVPVNILLPKGATKGTPIPFVVTGYGGYGVNIEPAFQSLRSVFLDAGIGLAVMNLRGGGEFGETWHEQGMLTKKQNVFDDFIGGVEHLVTQGYAKAGRIGIIGGSNGGLLMGAVMTQRPELFAAVASYVGIYDMLRVETEPNGAFNVPEFGTVTDVDQFRALYGYSPYHHVKFGVDYPPSIFLLGDNDVRVAPWHSRKMLARLQAAAMGQGTHLMVTSFDSGHGIGSSVQQVVDQNADGFGFLMHYLLKP